MCGIAGGMAFDRNAAPVDRQRVQRLTDLQRHRGPDGAGLWCDADSRTVFGHRRLAIIGMSPRSSQPMEDMTGRWVITYNGEIYNYRTLRTELEAAGCRFATDSDTEVLINVVACWGEAGLRKLRGMFAFALWDKTESELWLVRDPYGIKPLYVAESGGTLWFSSLARCLAAVAPIDTRRDAAALVGLYTFGHVPEPFSWWRGIAPLPAGHVLRVRLGEARAPSRAFSAVGDAYVPGAPLQANELRGYLSDSVRAHLVADVPVGLYLSSGVDSSALACLMVEQGIKPRTITLAFREFAGTPNDEAPQAEALAARIGADHSTVYIDREEFTQILDAFLDAMDQPTIDGLNSYLISRVARQLGLKVVLSGLGADEIFGGYPIFRQMAPMLALGRLGRLTAAADAVWRPLLHAVRPFHATAKLNGVFNHLGSIGSAYLLRRALHIEEELDSLLDERWVREGFERLRPIARLDSAVGPLQRRGVPLHGLVSFLESEFYMRNQLLRDTDWASMANGVEVRVPFVDCTLIRQIAPSISSHAPPRKEDLRTITALSRRLIPRRKKTGFVTPVRTWLGDRPGSRARGLRNWAGFVHQHFRTVSAEDVRADGAQCSAA